MRVHRWFLVPLILFFCIALFPSSEAQDNLPRIIKKVEPSIVLILTYDNKRKPLGQGSGFFINKQGDVITNRHVLKGASYAYVKTKDKKIYPIKKILAEDKKSDLIRVSVKIPHKAVHPLSLSTSLPKVGERIIVIGSPLGLEQTVTDGIVSAVRKIPAFGWIIQITAPLSPGSSGSPVINMKGKVIGVASFRMIKGENLNFAIPIQRAIRLALGKRQTFNKWQAKREKKWYTSAEKLYLKGFDFILAKDYKDALHYFEEETKKNPKYAKAYLWIGYCKYSLGQYREAIKAYKQAIRIKPDFAYAHFGLGLVYGSLGQYREAIKAFKEAIHIKPDFADAHCNLGVAYGSLGQYQKAIKALKQAIRIKPDLADAYCGLGLTYGS
ncbi:MAG: tetratricopeptide repeat protein, partial [Deltaproteobacteria bacterium]|nr:tetratricopeptide repeat protein [Deltaproteobacteria bacterium]